MGRRTSSIGYVTGAVLFLTVALTYVILSLGYLIDINSLKFALPLGFAGAAMLTFVAAERKPWIVAVISSAAIWFVAIEVCSYFVDSSCDGNFYHQEQVTLLFNGWNPYRATYDISVSEVWVNHYAMALEMVSAAVMCLSDNLQSGKAVGLVLAIATGLLSYGLLFGRSKRTRIIIALLIVANPVVICQLLTYYIDGTIYEYITLSVLLALAIVCGHRVRRMNEILMVAVVILAVGTKFNSFFMEVVTGVALIVGLVIYGYKKQAIRLAWICVVSGICAAFILGYYPYVLNWQFEGHPLYPLFGTGAIDIMSVNEGYSEATTNRFIGFLQSVFYVGLPSVAPQFGGFTPFFIIIFPLVTILCVRLVLCKRIVSPEVYACICVLVSCFLVYTNSSARYMPQLWLLVPIGFYIAKERNTGKCIAVLGLLAGAMCSVTTPLGSYRYTLRRNTVLDIMENSASPSRIARPLPQFERTFYERGIEYEIIDAADVPIENREMMYSFWLKNVGEGDYQTFVDFSDEQRRELDLRLRKRNFYKFGVAVRRLIGKDENVPFYN